MSEMIDRLSAFSHAAGQDAAAAFSTPEAIEVMATRVRTGRRRRRVRQSMVAAGVFVVAGVGFVAAPAILDNVDPTFPAVPVDPAARTIVSSEGSLTAFSDGTLSITLSNGQIMNLTPSELDEGTAFKAPLKGNICEATEDSFGALGWNYAGDGQTYKELVRFGFMGAYIDDAFDFQLVNGELYDSTDQSSESMKYVWETAFAFETDPAVAEHLVVRNTTVMFALGEPFAYASVLNPTPSFEVQGDDNVRAAWVQTFKGKPAAFNACGGHKATPPPDGLFNNYLISDVWISDSSGNAIQLGTFVSMIYVQEEVKEGGTL